jgi:hypothetical protein
MLIRRLYYALKPYLPWNVRIALRRFWAQRLLKANTAVWPIDATAATVPAGWPGWPDGKKFAVVLTHDVEGPEGLARCRELAEREMELGFRSCFNFIPEGTYTVPPELRAWLTANGFEVGVHDLEHDGHLFSSPRSFGKKAIRINHYLREWQAEGFRAGFMLRNLEWLHQLDIQYDCSTFDTDPFEPQPDAANTIYPFWVPAPPAVKAAGKGYVELPYTLPQDSTLYMLHRESTSDIWRAKLDWVAGHGGMVLLNVHPDYLQLGNENGQAHPTVLDHYLDLLRHLQKNHAGTFWHVLPRRLAAFVRAWQGHTTLTPSRHPSP